MQPLFRPEPRTNIKTVRHINYTCGPDRYAEMEALAKRSGVGLKELLRQMVDFAIAHAATTTDEGAG